MSVVKINVLQVPAERREVLEQRFAARAGEVDQTPGFESFELLRPTDDSDRYFVVTRWETEEAFTAWMESRAFRQGHAGGDGEGGGDDGSSRPSGPPAAAQAELLSFEIIEESRP
ncbi:antibiotic biosynthesis monooxygenase family protein [Salsipaludibacter albus]|uniref:antibiotic biosynthesis monooxygenase family protein n=1 Tax=Salsipaludibacter albus TaxID=2849650 RepID=UPI001EE3D7EA|nr:antibiotic biosynthesis monooxygenase [Salsipaludibacter albus]